MTLKIAFRNILLHKVKTMIIGSIIVFGTTLAIVGNSIVDAIATGMQRSLTQSVTGDIQIYNSEAKDQLSVLGNMDGSFPDVGHVNDFGKIRDTLLAKVPNIQSVIPMGSNFAMVSPGNILDVKLEQLRTLYNTKPRDLRQIAGLKAHLKEMITDIGRKLDENRASVGQAIAQDKNFSEAPKNLKIALSPDFWATFDAKYEDRIEFLANTMAPLIFDDSMMFLSYIGTAPTPFKETFSQFEIVKGSMIPEGKRGFLFTDYIYETMIKHRVARKLDMIKKRMDKNGTTIAASKEQQDVVAAGIQQAAEIYTQVSPDDARILRPKMQALLNSRSSDLRELTREFLKLDDANFKQRYDFFYREIAPHIVLYKVGIGDVFPITAFTKTGYSSSVNMKVYGTYRFKSFESSPIAGNFNLMDMMSFRELFGFMTAEKRAESQSLEQEMGLNDVNRDSIESMFTSSDSQPKLKAGKTSAIAQLGTLGTGNAKDRRRVFDVQYSRAEMENGVFISAAVTLKDPSRLSRTLDEIEAVAKSEKLGIRAIDWKASAGMMGQLTTMVRGVLYFLVLITFGVATFVIMNSMLMAAMDRVKEIGTMRAIGAQRKFILTLFLQETFILSFIFGAIGTLLGVIIIVTVGGKGLPAMGDPAMGDVSTFFFSGDRLFFYVNPLHILIVFLCMTVVAVVSTQYPAWRAMRISPLEAMQTNE